VRSRFQFKHANESAVAQRIPVYRSKRSERTNLALPRVGQERSYFFFVLAVNFILKDAGPVKMSDALALVVADINHRRNRINFIIDKN
jgi:hypothetical protein